jgi:hypothetical protein
MKKKNHDYIHKIGYFQNTGMYIFPRFLEQDILSFVFDQTTFSGSNRHARRDLDCKYL